MSRSPEPNPTWRSRQRQSLYAYLSVNEAHLSRFRDHFLIDEGLSFEFPRRAVRIRGQLGFVHGLVMEVTINLAVEANRRVGVAEYRFHAALDQDRHRPIFRYDNAHAYHGHLDAHHKHVFDPLDPDGLGTLEWVGAARQPSLGDAIDELFRWWFATGRLLELGGS